MDDVLGYKNFCQRCLWCKKEKQKLICKNKKGVFYKLSVENVLMAPCFKSRKENNNAK